MSIRTLLLTAFVLSLTLTAHADDAPRKPNIVLILADDLGYRELGCYGQKKIRTPNIDRLAKQGMRFTNHYAGNAVCAPSRCVLLTGKHPGHATIRNNRELRPEGQHPIPATEVTLAELLKKQGYTTGAFGKWGLGGPGSEGDPLRQGFDRFFGYNCQRHAHSYYPSYLWDNDKKIKLDNDPPVSGHARLPKDADEKDPRSYDRFKGKDYTSDRINEQALAFVRENRDRPFFLYYPTVLPHLALHVPDEELEQYHKLGWTDPPFTKRNGGGYTPHFTPRAAYAAMITRMDRYVGRLLDELDKQGLADNTIVIFTSDNGTTHIKEEADYDFFASVGELRGLKGSLYEGGVRVPTVVRWPKHIAPNSSAKRVTGFEDWMPTLLDLIGASSTTPQSIDGLTFAPTLLGKKQKPRPFLYREFSGYGGQQSLRVGYWKAIRTGLRKGKSKIQLYNLSTDPSEKNDVAAEYPAIVKKLDTLMRAQHTRSKLFPLKNVD